MTGDVAKHALKGSKTIAVVGVSPRPERYSHKVAKYLKDQGYKIIPVNPTAEEVLGEKSYQSLGAVPGRVDIVDIFRRAEFVPAIVEEAIRIGAKAVWMQEGIVSEKAAARAQAAGLTVVMDRCLMKTHRKLSR